MARRCVFCDSQPVTREHGLPKWLDTVLSHIPDITQTLIGDDSIPQSRGKRNTLSGMEIRAVCKSCNGGWMSDLEQEAKPIIGPMVAGRGIELNKVAQNIAATWIIKTSLILSLSNAKVKNSMALLCKSLFVERSPLENFHISVGAYTQDKFISIHHLERQTLRIIEEGVSADVAVEAHLSTLVIGNFVAQAWFLPDNELSVTFGGPSLRMIFPYVGDFIWPPGRFLNTEQIQRLAQTDLPVHPDETLSEPNEPWKHAD